MKLKVVNRLLELTNQVLSLHEVRFLDAFIFIPAAIALAFSVILRYRLVVSPIRFTAFSCFTQSVETLQP